MDFQSFQTFVALAAVTLQRLLKHAGVKQTTEMVDKVRSFYGQLTDDDIQCYRKSGTIPRRRLLELAHEIGLEPRLAELPLELFKLHSAEQANQQEYSRLTEEEVVFYLTNGQISVEYCSIVGGAIVRWNPNSAKVSFLLEHDENIALYCMQYLTSKGRRFDSVDDLQKYAKDHHWPGWERIKTEYDNPFGEGEGEVVAL